MSKHTPGPWSLGDSNLRVSNLSVHAPSKDRKHSTILRMVHPGYGMSFGELYADAKLIAAAPEMLDMLKKCLDALVYVGPWETPVGLIGKVQAIIDKAEGNDATTE